MVNPKRVIVEKTYYLLPVTPLHTKEWSSFKISKKRKKVFLSEKERPQFCPKTN
jgi:hypothetical protein